MQRQLIEDMYTEPSSAPVIEVLYAEDGALVGWAEVIEGQGVDTGSGIIDLADITIYQIRIKNEKARTF